LDLKSQRVHLPSIAQPVTVEGASKVGTPKRITQSATFGRQFASDRLARLSLSPYISWPAHHRLHRTRPSASMCCNVEILRGAR